MLYDIERSVEKRKLYVFEDERFVDLNLYQYGWEPCASLQSFGPYVRNHYLFHLVISGKGVFLANDQEYRLHAGQGFLICPGQITSYTADKDEPWEYTWLEFDGMHVRESLISAGISLKNPIWRPVNREAAQLLQEQMLMIVKLAENVPSCTRAYYNKSRALAILGHGFLFLDQLIQSSARKDNGTNKSPRDLYVKEAIAFIEQNYQQDISIEELANICNLHRGYFSRIFKESMGESPQQFLLHYRMSKAAQMLRESNLPVYKIGTMVNYPNQLHFSRAFKKIYGVAPREYRQKYFVDDGAES